jgi:DNA-binding MurR/RpiR family transcriptional regulator
MQKEEKYESLIQLIEDKFHTMSKTYKEIANYLTQNPNEIPIISSQELAKRCNTHPSSLVRFSQMLGYAGFKEVQNIFRKRLSHTAPGFESRIQSLSDDLKKNSENPEFSFLKDLVLTDIASLEELLENTDTDSLLRATEMMAKADNIYLLGQLRSLPVVELLRYVLTMLNIRTILLDSSGGLSTHMARLITKKDLLIAVSFQQYATEVVDIVHEVADRGEGNIIAITDSHLSPLSQAEILFALPERQYSFSRSLAAPMCLIQALSLMLASKMKESIM